jgi:hypothetical protein
MGGSSLAPELFARVFTPWTQLYRPELPHLPVSVLDTTEPDAIGALEKRLRLKHTPGVGARTARLLEERVGPPRVLFSLAQDDLEARGVPRRLARALTDAGPLQAARAEVARRVKSVL